MDVHEAVTSRRAVRGFTDRPVPAEVLRRVLSAAAWAPSGSNLQPWHAYVLTGGPLAELKKQAGERIAAGDPWDEPEYEQYPPALKSPTANAERPSADDDTTRIGVEQPWPHPSCSLAARTCSGSKTGPRLDCPDVRGITCHAALNRTRHRGVYRRRLSQ